MVTPDEAIKEAASTLRPVYLVVGEERFLADAVTDTLRQKGTVGGIAGFNEDRFQAGESSIDSVIAAARTLPMMAPRRVILVRGLERWEGKGDDSSTKLTPLDALADYCKEPVDSTVLILVASKLHGQRRIVTGAKKGGYLVACDPLHRRDLPRWIEARVKERGHSINRDVAADLAEIVGPELGGVADAIERLSLYVGEGKPITEDAVAVVITPVRPSTTWDLVDALCARRLGEALSLLGRVEGGRDSELPLLGSMAWAVRQLLKFEGAIAEGQSPDDAARRAGIAPFKVMATRDTLRKTPRATLLRWIEAMAEADLALKGSKRQGRAVLEALLVDLCR